MKNFASVNVEDYLIKYPSCNDQVDDVSNVIKERLAIEILDNIKNEARQYEFRRQFQGLVNVLYHLHISSKITGLLHVEMQFGKTLLCLDCKSVGPNRIALSNIHA
ncbi:hypothetical protein N8977_04855, partial [Alphaproteobacteria bacterium]|nr:hypothetical protein [Alphaproteobacteria bacterium]